MALIKCNECGKSISDAAKSCPGCGAPVPEKPRKRGLLTWVFLGLFGWIVFVMATPGDNSAPSATSLQPRSTGFHITYGVEAIEGSTDTASITYTNGQGGTEQVKVKLPWLQSYQDVPPGTHLYVSAQNNQDYGALRVRILVDGQAIKESVASGGYTIATANTRCCPR